MSADSASELDTEIKLLWRIGQGDRESFAIYYDRIAGTLFAIAHRLLHSREAAEDVVQDVFVQIWEKAPLYDPAKGKPMTWAVTLTRNKAIDRLRAIQRRSQLQDDLEQESSAAESIHEPSSFDAVAISESGKLLRDAMRELGEEHREVIELAFFRSLSQSEIAERLGQPLGTVKARIRRGLLKLRELITPRL